MRAANVFQKNLRVILRSRKMSQVDLARATGLTPTTISLFLSGKREPSFESTRRVIKALDVKFERMIK